MITRRLAAMALMVFFLLQAPLIYGQINVISRDSLLIDFDLMVTSMKEGNAALYNYKSQPEIEKIFAQARSRINDMTLIEFHSLLVSVISDIEDGHTRLQLPKNIQDYVLNESRSLLPLSLRFIEDKIYVFRNYSSLTEIKGGEEVVMLNGISTAELLRDLRRQVSSDGNNNAFKNRRLDLEQAILLSFRFKMPDNYLVKLRMQDNTIADFTLKTVNQSNIDSVIRIKYNDQVPLRPKWDYVTTPIGNIAILTIRDFLNGANRNYFNFLDSIFTDLSRKKIPNLVIDIRENTGGFDGHAAAVAGYIAKVPFQFYKTRITNKNSYDFLKYTNSAFYNNMFKSVKTEQTPDGRYQLNLDWDTLNTTIRPDTYTGNVYILINSRVSSSGSSFAVAVCNNPSVKFVGEETGGAYRGSSGATVILYLPQSKLQVLIPLVWSDHNLLRENKSIGLQPDFKIARTIDDLLKNKDPQMEFVLRKINQ